MTGHPDHKPAGPLADLPPINPVALDHFVWMEPTVDDDGQTYLVAPRSCDRCWEHPLDYWFGSIDDALNWRSDWLTDELDIEAEPEELIAIEAEAAGWVLVTVHRKIIAGDVLDAFAEAAREKNKP